MKNDILDINQLKKPSKILLKLEHGENLSRAIASEAGELLEIFQWLTAEESINIRKKLS